MTDAISELWLLLPVGNVVLVVLVVLFLVGVGMFFIGVTTCPGCWIFMDCRMRSTLEETSDWNSFMSCSIAVILVCIVFIEFLVVIDNVDVEDVEVFEDLEDVLVALAFVVPLSFIFAFLLVEVAILEGGARLDWKVETESSSPLSLTNT